MEQIEAYNRTNLVQIYMNNSIIDRFSRMLTWKSNETVLDIGMGDGKFTVEGLLPRLPSDIEMLVGSEYMPCKVEFAKMKYQNPKVEFVDLDIQTMELREDFIEKFDHVFSFFVLNWVHDLEQALENIYAMLKPGGEFLVALSERCVNDAFHNLSKNPKWSAYNHEQYASRFVDVTDRLQNWRNLFLDTGFVDLDCFREFIVYRQKSREICEEMFKSLNPIAAEIPKDELEEYYRDYLEEVRKAKQCCFEICPETQKEICTTNFDSIIILGKKPNTHKYVIC